MISREEIIRKQRILACEATVDIIEQVEKYLKDNGITKPSLLQNLALARYISQILNGDYDHN
jgi:hypothetical protein